MLPKNFAVVTQESVRPNCAFNKYYNSRPEVIYNKENLNDETVFGVLSCSGGKDDSSSGDESSHEEETLCFSVTQMKKKVVEYGQLYSEHSIQLAAECLLRGKTITKIKIYCMMTSEEEGNIIANLSLLVLDFKVSQSLLSKTREWHPIRLCLEDVVQKLK